MKVCQFHKEALQKKLGFKEHKVTKLDEITQLKVPKNITIVRRCTHG